MLAFTHLIVWYQTKANFQLNSKSIKWAHFDHLTQYIHTQTYYQHERVVDLQHGKRNNTIHYHLNTYNGSGLHTFVLIDILQNGQIIVILDGLYPFECGQ